MKELYFEYKTSLFRKGRLSFNEQDMKHALGNYFQLCKTQGKVDVYYNNVYIPERDVKDFLIRLSSENVVVKTSEGLELITIYFYKEDNDVDVDVSWSIKNKEELLKQNMIDTKFFFFIKSLVMMKEMNLQSVKHAKEIVCDYINVFKNEDYDILYNI